MAHAKWAALTFGSKLMEPNFSKFVLLNCTFFIPLTLEKALDLLLGLIIWAWFQNVTACLFMACLVRFHGWGLFSIAFLGAIALSVWATMLQLVWATKGL